nr:uncharacterized protein LOC109182886 [Ipomoea batatas]
MWRHNKQDYSYLTRKRHVPAFGNWDCNQDFPIPFTQCFESATHAGLRGDLYVAGDLYDNHILTPAMIVVPRRKGKAQSYNNVGGGGGGKGLEGRKDAWVVCDCDCDNAPPPPPKRAPKAVDEDLYKISPDLLYSKPKQRRVWGFLLSCLRPSSCA